LEVLFLFSIFGISAAIIEKDYKMETDLLVFGKKIESFSFRTFEKAERSSFAYWFNHWKAFNLVAIALKVWRPKYLLHDIEKPWLMLLWKDYKRVQTWHRQHNNHHFWYKGKKKLDPLAMIIDSECSRFTKKAAPLTAKEQAESELKGERKEFIEHEIFPLLKSLGLTE